MVDLLIPCTQVPFIFYGPLVEKALKPAERKQDATLCPPLFPPALQPRLGRRRAQQLAMPATTSDEKASTSGGCGSTTSSGAVATSATASV